MALPRTTALGVFAAAALSAAAVLYVWPNTTSTDERRPDGAGRARGAWQQFDTLDAGQTLLSLLQKHGLTAVEASAALHAATAIDPRHTPAGLVVGFVGLRQGDARLAPSKVSVQLSPERTLHLTRRPNGPWTARDERVEWALDTVVAHGVVHSTLYDALDEGAGKTLPSKASRVELAWAIADIFEYRIDMSRELQDGDRVRVAFVRARSPLGATRVKAVLAAGVERGGKELQAFRYTPKGAAGAAFFDATGRSLRAAFLKAPLKFNHISSVFGPRKHPILGEWRAHKGTDYAAAAGAPVRTVGDGVVVFVGERTGYGNCVDVRHANGYVTRYAHLRGFAPGIKAGARVKMERTIGFVGMTGLATAPHLHFEVLVAGVQRDPRVALAAKTGMPLAAADRTPFLVAQRLEAAQLDRPSGAGVALRN